MSVRWIVTTEGQHWQEREVAVEQGARPQDEDLVLSGSQHQPIEGFGGCFNEYGWQALAALDAPRRQEVLAALFGPAGCRFTMGRVPIGASDYALEWYSHAERPDDFAMEHFSIDRDARYLIPYVRAALELQPALTLMASPWSPPTWLKLPRAYNHGTLIWEPHALEAYARYLLRFVQAYHDAGLPVRQLHVQNEPSADQKFPSCVWTGQQMREFIRDYLGPLFQRAGAPCEIWLGTINSDDYDAWANLVLSDAAARGFIAGVGYQWAGKGAIQRTHESWPELRLMQTENECGDGNNSWAYAHYVFTLLRHYLGNGARAYLYWNMVLPPGGMSTWGWRQNAMVTVDPASQTVTYNPEFFVLRHVSAAVEPGARRLGLAGPLAGNALAFANPGGALALVVANPLPEPRRLRLHLPAQTIAVELEPGSFNTLLLA